MNWPQILILIGSALVIVGGFWSAMEQSKSDKEMLTLSIKNQELTQELNDQITGGNSYPYFFFDRVLSDFNNDNLINLILIIKGDRPLYDTKVDVTDITGDPDFTGVNPSQTAINALRQRQICTINGGTYLPNRAFSLVPFEMPLNVSQKKFRISTIARNGAFDQIIELRKRKDGQWETIKVKVTKEVRNAADLVLDESLPTDK